MTRPAVAGLGLLAAIGGLALGVKGSLTTEYGGPAQQGTGQAETLSGYGLLGLGVGMIATALLAPRPQQ